MGEVTAWNGLVYVIGGGIQSGQTFDTVEAYDHAANP
jgi:Kelch motif